MKNLIGINDYLTEKRITVKRRYTENYPAKLASTSAKVRNALFDAMADGHLTEDEILKVLSEINANKRWLGRNSSLFNISEDQSGVKTYSLSPYGQRIRSATKTLNEGLNVPHKDKGKKPVNIFVGRFQPFTLGHVKVFEQMYKKNGYPVVVYLVRGGKPDPEKRPFDEDLQQAMFAEMTKQYPFLEAAFVVPNGGIDTLFAAARPAYEPMMWGYGTDRKKAYDFMINKPEYRESLGVDPDFTGFEIKRTDDDVSASKVRNALSIDDEKTFNRMTPKSIHKFYKTLQDTLQPIKENYNMKNIKALNEFINENTINEKNETGLKVYPKTPSDFKKLTKWLDLPSSPFGIIDDREGLIFFPEKTYSMFDLEDKLSKEFNKAKISARFKSVWESFINERNTKLYVYALSKKDHQMISNWLERSAFHAEEDSNSFMFPVSDQRDADATEKELDKEFAKLGANARFVLESQS